MLKSLLKSLFSILFLLIIVSEMFAQTLNDGPIQLQLRVREWDVTLASPNDITLNAGFFNAGAIEEDEYTFKIWGRGNAVNTTWFGGSCYTDEFDPSLLNSSDFNDIFYNQTYAGATVPAFFDLRIDCHEDDVATDFASYFNGGLTQCANTTNFPRCDFNNSVCCVSIFGNCLYSEGDDIHCDANAFKTNVNYRLGPPCQWYNHGFQSGSGCVDNVYNPRVESYWRYTKGTGCNDAIDLGTLGATPLTHFNSNECYSNNFPGSAGNDVFYSFTITQPMGVTASLCGTATFNTAIYLLDPNCQIISFNDDFCNLTSQVSRELCVPGTYYVVVDAPTGADMGTFTLNVSEEPNLLLDVNAGTDRTVCIGQTSALGGTPAAQYGLGPYNYAWSPAAGLNNSTNANPVFTATAPGTLSYILTVTDANNCSISDTVIVTVGAPPTAGISTNTNIICNGTNATLTATGGSGLPPYQFLFNGGTLPGGTNSTYNATLQGNYSVIAYSTLGCPDTSGIENIQVVSNALANISAAGNTTICQGNSVVLNGYGIGLNYQWLNNNVTVPGATSNNYTATTPGNYSVILSFGGQCADTSATLPVVVNPTPNATISPNTAQTICQGQSVGFTAGGGGTYQWYQNGIAIPGATAANYTASQTGGYSVIATINGCTDSSPIVNVTVQPVTNAAITAGGNTTFCQGGSVTLVGSGSGAPGQVYSWTLLPNTPAGSSNSLVVTQSGSYTFTLTANGCTSTSPATTVTVNTQPTAGISPAAPQTICQGQSVLFTGTGGGSYQWYQNGVLIPGATGQTYTATQTGNYSVSVSSNGCTDESALTAVTVQPVANAAITAGGPLTFCQGGDVTLVGSGNNTPGQSYTWLQLPSTSAGNSNSITVSQPGSYVFILNSNGCADTSSATTITVNSLPNATISPSGVQTICEGSFVTLTAGGGNTYQWYVNGQMMNGATSASLPVGTAGAYYAVVTDNIGCEAITPDVLVEVTPLLPASIAVSGPATICQGESVVLSGSGTGGSGQTYSWLSLPSLNVVGNGNTFTASASGTYQFILNNNGCIAASSSVNVVVNPLPSPTLSPSGAVTICGDDDVTIVASGGGTGYEWVANGVTVSGNNTNQYTATMEGTYYVSITDINGCTGSSVPMVLSFAPLPDAQITADGSTVICEGSSVLLSASGGDTYQWYLNGTLLNGEMNPTIAASSSGTYSVVVNNGCGADTSGLVSVQVSEYPVAGFFTDMPEVYVGVPVQFIDQSINASTWQWNLENGAASTLQNPVYIYFNAGTYPVTLLVENEIGCSGEIVLNINVTEGAPFIPNAFTPNGDGFHDALETNFNVMKTLQFQIFDRWGKVIFSTTGKDEFWNGKINDKEAPSGTYYYSLTGKGFTGREIEQKGWVMMMR
ncbi:MAG: gliding motility-associated C-terminal domain-containing protein [Bacteroidia bacterium]|nr:gliding motility-associated C-terminal domain-containing protein [Bacteroidia bacterium]